MAGSAVFTVTKPRQWLLRAPSISAPQETELLFGHRFRAQPHKNSAQNKDWVYGQELSPLGQDIAGYTGWMRRSSLADEAAPSTHVPRSHVIDALKAPIFSRLSIKSRIRRVLPLGAHIAATAENAPFLKLASGGYVHQSHTRPLGSYSDDFVSIAARHYGLPYIWGGISSDGLDCSGLVQSALRATGRDCLRDAGQQENSLGQALTRGAALQRADLIFWPGHVGILEDAQTLLHANAFHMKVEREPLRAAIARIGEPRSIRRLAR